MSDYDFDLLGDPIPEGHGGRGRPEHVRTERNRSKVIMLLAMGWSNPRIARSLGITPPTLKKHYFRELKVREEALDRLKAGHMSLLWDQAKAGNVAALKEIGKLIDRIDAASFGALAGEEKDDPEEDAADLGDIGKKERANIAARTAGQGSGWGDDLIPPGTRAH
ncbi:hypothetical protein O4H52_01045 [Sphingomonadaceae bacterium G21617-S1]|nr:hypothetical protein [Sphingomonadaceae bacterium G21617-S1]